jgi:hypothetical protein
MVTAMAVNTYCKWVLAYPRQWRRPWPNLQMVPSMPCSARVLSGECSADRGERPRPGGRRTTSDGGPEQQLARHPGAQARQPQHEAAVPVEQPCSLDGWVDFAHFDTAAEWMACSVGSRTTLHVPALSSESEPQ